MVNGAPAPDTAQQLLAMQSLINSSASNGKPAYLFGIFPMDINVGNALSATTMSPFGKTIPTLFSGTGGKPGGIGAKFLDAIASIPEDLRKRAQEANVMYSGDLPSGSIFSSGSGFASNVGGSRGGDFDMSV